MYFPEELMNMGQLYDYSGALKGQPGYRVSQVMRDADHAWAQIENARRVIATIEDAPLPGEHWKGLSKQDQERLKVKKVKEGARHFGFVFEGDWKGTKGKPPCFADGSRSYQLPKFKKNAQMELCYKWLTEYGYQMSTEEIEMMSGTHSIFQEEIK